MTDASNPRLRLDNGDELPIQVRGYQLLGRPMLNRGTAFTHDERKVLGLTGLLPTGSNTIESQVRRVYAQYQAQGDDLSKNVFLTQMRDRNEVLFYNLLSGHL